MDDAMDSVTSMTVATFRKLCIDAVDPEMIGRFWAAALTLAWRPDTRPPAEREGGVYGADERPVLWVNRVSEPKRVKHRVHLDLYASALADLEALGARVVLPEGDDRHWTVMADPEGGEFCAFLRDPVPEPRLHGLVVDSADPAAQARFWVAVLGGEVEDHPNDYSTADRVPGMSYTFDFVPVPEPKTGPNRIHWDLAAPHIAPIVNLGATVLRAPDDEISWHVLADPEGNEFCVFDATG
jgi:catechol 2,3-dioxygenase-like lactoylglutathione lyase family enzyme